MSIYFFDTEFVDTGESIDLISVGIAALDGRTYYAEVMSPEQIAGYDNEWLMANVVPHLVGPVLTRREVANAIVEFVGRRPEFWAYVADYDWVALSQLYGSLINRPATWPWTALDTYQLPDFKQYVVKPTDAHNALADAIALKLSWISWREAWPGYVLPAHSSPREDA